MTGNVAADWIAPRTPPCADDAPCDTDAVAPRTPLEWAVPPVTVADVPAAAVAVTCAAALTPAVTVVDVPALAHAALELLFTAWTSTACLCLQSVTLCGWLFPGPYSVVPEGAPDALATCAAVVPLP